MDRTRVFYGWWVALAFSVMVFLSTGIRFAVGPFLKPLVADLATDRASYSLVVSLSLFLAAALVSPLIDERPRCVRRLVPVTGGR